MLLPSCCLALSALTGLLLGPLHRAGQRKDKGHCRVMGGKEHSLRPCRGRAWWGVSWPPVLEAREDFSSLCTCGRSQTIAWLKKYTQLFCDLGVATESVFERSSVLWPEKLLRCSLLMQRQSQSLTWEEEGDKRGSKTALMM